MYFQRERRRECVREGNSEREWVIEGAREGEREGEREREKEGGRERHAPMHTCVLELQKNLGLDCQALPCSWHLLRKRVGACVCERGGGGEAEKCILANMQTCIYTCVIYTLCESERRGWDRVIAVCGREAGVD